MMEDVEQIARSLSEEQKKMLVGTLEDGPVFRELAAAGLAWKLGSHFDLQTGAVRLGGLKLRTLGLAVRDCLSADANDPTMRNEAECPATSR